MLVSCSKPLMLLLLTTLFCAVLAQGCKSKADRLYQEGQAKYKAGDVLGALDSYEQGLKIKRNHVELLYGLGWALFSLGRYPEALANFTRCVNADDDYYAGYKGKGAVYAAMGNPDKALQEYGKALERAPKNAAIYQNMGDLYRSIGKQEDAQIAYNKAVSLLPQWGDPHVGLMGLFMERKSYDEVIAQGERALALPFEQINIKMEAHRLLIAAYQHRANHLEKEGKQEAAGSDYNKATKIASKARQEFNNPQLFVLELASPSAEATPRKAKGRSGS